MKTAIYARVSSEKQAEKDLSIPGQLKALRKYAFDKNWEIVTEYVDEAESARSADRPSFQRMINASKKKDRPFDKILVWKLSRFARNREDSIIYKSLLRKRGISLISINEQIDDTASGRLLEGMIEVIDEFYSANLAQDTIRGMKENASRGFNNGGIIPFGYRKSQVLIGSDRKTKLEVCQTEASIIKQVFQMALHGKGCREIASSLNINGFRSRLGKSFSATIINYWLKNPVYTGTLVWNRDKQTAFKSSRAEDGKAIYIEKAHPALVSKDDFIRVRNLLSDRRPIIRHPRTVSSQYLLSGLVFCSSCDSAMIGSTAKSGRYSYYQCNARAMKGKRACHGLRVAKDKLEQFVLNRIKESILTEENLTELVHLVNVEFLDNTKRKQKELKEVEQQLKKVSTKLSKLYSVLESGKLDLDDLAPRIKELRAEQRELQERRNQFLNYKQSENRGTLDSEVVISYVKELGDVLSEASFLQQKTFLRSFIKRVEIDSETVTMDYTIPVPTDNNTMSLKEVLRIDKTGSPTRTRT